VIVIIDTNVWISALQFAKHRGTPTLVLEKAMSEDVIATCDEIDAEIVRVLTEKFSWEQHRATSALQAILARCIRVKIRGTVKKCRDPHDDYVSGVRRPCESGSAGCRRKGFIDPRRVQGDAHRHPLGVHESKISIPAIAQR
jgi:predicted nucleic acid-binding protein